jgi:site-specific DNA-methyltransferase (adenine-specific)
MTPYYETELGRLYCGEAAEVLPHIGPVHAVVCDPPYGLKFMGKAWDYQVPSVETWKACYDALLPGGHLLSFAGTRTQHRMAVNIEDAGFEIRDMIAWVYGC